MRILIFQKEYWRISNPRTLGVVLLFPLIFQLNKLNQVLSPHGNTPVSYSIAYFSCLLGGRNFELSSLIFTKSSSFLDPYHTKSLRKVKQRGEAEKINFL